ncbi:MAG: N-acetyl-D-myo-inositol-2-amino-2-deoxy-alpha-D-glucopyranoside deacetylase [Frankiaceae bacterium]|jgi:N-acetyl-1-D-myo-inositol-2-amino-2-deoxy-alpha-D-glucopyranoside deacetylase|nr:N-acetyl-D-myo-inositol-2-amino-2-deoxy-alpha-D-glucopyranoside deacetylase [Frankiaceae bacterium]
MLLVHAHPDDETIGTGATMAKYAAEGAHVTLVTCTLGEEGEILVPDLVHLAADKNDALGEHRIGELDDAMKALGVSDHRFLGGPGRWRDSGMMGEPANDRADCFWQADLDVAVGELVKVMREVRPQVVITYNEIGGYGHPDHIQAHRVAISAYEAAADPARYPDAGEPWVPAKLYYMALPLSFLKQGWEALKAMGEEAPFGVTSPEELPFGDPDEIVTTRIDARDFLDRKTDAMRAHRTQIQVDGPFFALSNDIGQRAFGLEHYRMVRGTPPPAGAIEEDVFAGM